MEIINDISSLWLLGFIAIGFTAGYIDAIAGGGGMIQALALLAAGVPPINTLATNKVASITGTTTAIIRFSISKKINWYLATACLIPALILSAIGSQLVIYINEQIVAWMIILCIPVAFLFVFKKQKQYQENEIINSRKKAILVTAPIAFYDGLIGPGAGTYWAIAINKFLHINFLSATAMTKPINAATNIGALIIFIYADKVVWNIAIPMAFASFAGAYIGTQAAIKKGDSFVRKIMIYMLLIMLAFNIYKLIF